MAYNICNKNAVALVGTTCDVGYTEWLDGSCFVNCNYLFIENGTTCIKKTYARDSVFPISGTGSGSGTGAGVGASDAAATNGTWLFIITLVLLVSVFVILGIFVWRYTEKKPNYLYQPVN